MDIGEELLAICLHKLSDLALINQVKKGVFLRMIDFLGNLDCYLIVIQWHFVYCL